jgi:hypothetical protein
MITALMRGSNNVEPAPQCRTNQMKHAVRRKKAFLTV